MPQKNLSDHRLLESLSKRVGSLRQERASFIGQYKELSKFVTPRKGRFDTSDRNKGDKRWNEIINSKATGSLRISRAGMMAGTMSPAEPWFKLETIDPGMMEFLPVKTWLKAVEEIINDIFRDSNLYSMSSSMMGELMTFATGLMTHVNDFKNVARFYTHTAGSYMLIQNADLEVDGFAREYMMNTDQLVQDFGTDRVSLMVKEQYDRGDYDAWHPVTHIVERNPDYDPNKLNAKFKRFRSVRFQPSEAGESKPKILNRGGFNQFPGYAPRWDVTGEDIYGTDCPAMTSLGDIKQLQVQEKRKLQAIDKLVNPPLRGPASIKGQPTASLPGSLNLYDATGEQGKLEPVYQVDPKLQEMRLDITAVERRIQDAFLVDMFQAITNMEGIQPKNQLELTQRDNERLLQLGPVLQRMHHEFLDQLIDRTFEQALNADILPPPPEEIAGAPLRIKYVSALALAQRSVMVANVEQVTGFVVGLMSNGFPEAGLKYDAQQAVDEYARLTGAPPSIIRTDDAVAEIQQQQQQQQQAAQNAELAQMGASAAADGSKAMKTVVETADAAGAQ